MYLEHDSITADAVRTQKLFVEQNNVCIYCILIDLIIALNNITVVILVYLSLLDSFLLLSFFPSFKKKKN